MLLLERRTLQGHCGCPFEDWGKLLGDVPSATAILDRFLHHATIIAITGRSYRLRNQARTESETAAGEDADHSKPAISPAGSPPAGKRKKCRRRRLRLASRNDSSDHQTTHHPGC